MCDLTVVNPTSDPFPIGEDVHQACTVGVYAGFDDRQGSGTVTTYTSEEFSANGEQSNGKPWSASIVWDGANWDITVSVTESGDSRQFSASCSASGSSLRFTDNQSSDSLLVSQNNGTILTDGGQIDFQASWISTTPTFYIASA